MSLNTAFVVLPGTGIEELPEGVLTVTSDYVLGEEAITNALPAGYLGAFSSLDEDGDDTVTLAGYELMVSPELVPRIAETAVTAVFAGNSKTWLLIIDMPDDSRMLTINATGITAEEGEPVDGEPTTLIDGDPEKTLKEAVKTLTDVDLDEVINGKGVLVVVEN